MAHIPFHPAPGLGDLLPGYFVVPQNPISDAGTPLAPSVQATAPNKVLRVRGIGEILPASWTVPQNPLTAALATVGQPAGQMSSRGMGCVGCTSGLGDLSSSMSDDSLGLGLPNWAYLAGAGVLAWILFMPGGSEYRQKRSALASQYTGIARARKAARGALS